MKIKYGIVILLCCMLSVHNVYAADMETPRLMQNDTDEHAIHLFVKGVKEPEEITCRFGSHICTEIGWHTLTEIGETRETLVLIDNSLSTGRKYREQIELTVLKLFENASENEKFCVATFGETTEYLTEYTNLYTPLEEAVLGIEYCDRETYLTDAILEALDRWQVQEAPEIYRRVIVITDGQEAASLSHTHEELYLYLKDTAYPIYTVGCTTGNQQALSHMAVLSRMSGAAAYTIDRGTGETEAEETVLSLLEDKDVLHITMVPEEEWMDGSDVNARLMFLKDGVVSGLELSLTMPFQPEKAAAEELIEAAITETPMVTPVQLPAEQEPQEPEKPEAAWLTATIGIMLGVLLLLVSGYAAVLKLIERHRKQEQAAAYGDTGKPFSGIREEGITGNLGERDWEQYGDTDTRLLRSDDEEGDSQTTVLFGAEETYEMVLTDQNNPAKFFSFPLRDSVIIGRSARSSQIVLDYDASVSGRHCEIENRGGRFFVRDLQSSNGTRVNGIKVLSETELLIGNLLRLGQVEMKVGWSMYE